MVSEVDPAFVALRPEPGAGPRIEPSRGEPEPRRGTVADMIATALAWYEARGSDQARVLGSYLERGELAAIHSLGADTPAAEVTPDMVTRWLRKVAAANVNTHHPRSWLSRASPSP